MLEVNEYFEGKVKSITLKNGDGKATTGVMAPGAYEFGTATHETMQVIEGEMMVKLPNSSEWTTYKSGESYDIEANEKFQVKVSEQTAYLCRYK